MFRIHRQSSTAIETKHSRRSVLVSGIASAATGIAVWLLPVKLKVNPFSPGSALAYDCPLSNAQCPYSYAAISCSFQDCAVNCYCNACGGDSSAGYEQVYIHCSGYCFNNSLHYGVSADCSYQYAFYPYCSCTTGGCLGNYGQYAYIGSC